MPIARDHVGTPAGPVGRLRHTAVLSPMQGRGDGGVSGRAAVRAGASVPCPVACGKVATW
jgi:hypothetical protein